MSETGESNALPKRGTKLTRNEGRKLAATALNNAGLAFMLAGILQPIVSSAQADSWPQWRLLVVSVIFIAISGSLFAIAQWTIRRLED